MKVLRPGDFDGSGVVNGDDWDAFNAAFVDPALAPLSCDIDVDGTVTGSDYDLFGQLWEECLATHPDQVRLGYAGYARDPTTGLLLARNRWYDASVGRWITRDPAGYVDGLSLYLYARGNPFGLVDPMGLDSLKMSEFVGYLFGFGEDGTAGKVWGAAGEGALSNPRKIKDAATGVLRETVATVGYAAGLVDDEALAQNSAIYKAMYNVTLAGDGDTLRGVGKVAKALPGQVVESVKETASAVADGDLETIGDLSFAAGSLVLSGAANAGRAGAELAEEAGEQVGKVAGKVAAKTGKGGRASLPLDAQNAVRMHGNSLDYVGETHVYRIKSPDGSTYKIGESTQGTRIHDGASVRAEQQVRRLNRTIGPGFMSEIRKTFPDKASARGYETRVIDRFRRLYGEDTLPGNRTNH